MTEPQEPLSTQDLVGRQRDQDASAQSGGSEAEAARPLLPETDEERYRKQWQGIQAAFVDEPRRAVRDADELVAEVIRRLAEVFADERGGLERQWDRGDEVSTEDLRVALQRYRSFFDRLLQA